MRRYADLPPLLLLFLLSLLPLSLSQLPATQRTVMTALSQSINSSAWDTTDPDPDPCNWPGVRCTQNTITHLSLSSLKISSSSFLPLLCNLDSLRSLDVSNNYLSSLPFGFFANCTGLGNLQSLNFSTNELKGAVPTFVGFSSLESLDLSANSLGGNIISQFDGLVSLRSLNLSGNLFDGPVPTLLGKSMALEELQLSKNIFDGGIPDGIAAYRNLTRLDLSSNRLSGLIPDRLSELLKLEILVLSSNLLSGAIPQNLSRIWTLLRFAANQNRLSGSIPSGITKHVRNLDLSYNNLNGSMPPDLLSPQNLVSVDLSANALEGPIPVDMSPSLFRLRLGQNLLSGTIPSSIGQVLELIYFEAHENRLSGEIPPELVKCEKLTLLNLAQNQLQGLLPKGLGNLTELVVLKLDENKLSGEIPAEISQLKNLSIINLSRNSLVGVIPSGITGLTKLSNLNLQSNRLNGSIPDGFENLESLLEVQLGDNQLAGSILTRAGLPAMPTRLQIALNLSRNHLEGPIPSSLSALESLEVLDLSNNRFTGDIPGSLAGMGSLTQLDLSNNQLSGIIPQLPSRAIVNTAGNEGLVSPTVTTRKRRNLATSVTAGFAVGVVAAIAAVALVFVVLRRFHRVHNENPELEGPVPQVNNGRVITTDSIHLSNIDFKRAIEVAMNPANIIFRSRFCTYYKAIMPSGMSYCVKKLNWSDQIFQLGGHEQFRQQLEALARLRNSKIMTPLAYVVMADCVYMFYEHAHNGTVFDFLHKNVGAALNWPSRYSIALGVAQGLSFLHGCHDPVLLLDLSTKTIVLKSLNEPQIADIELCKDIMLYKLIDPPKSTRNLFIAAGSVGYSPPEYANKMRLTMAGNVYNFGAVLLELLTGKPSVREETELAEWVFSNSAQTDAWEQTLDPTISKTSPAVLSQMLSVLKIAQACVSVSPEARPKMKNVLRMLLNAV